jgi:uncharacterized protein
MIRSYYDFSGDVEPIRHSDVNAKIVSLAGGGFRGVFTTRILKLMEKRLKNSIRDNFQLIIGTSTGSLIAAGLALGVKASVLEDTYIELGSQIFVPSWTIPLIGMPRLSSSLSRIFFRAPYTQTRLRDAIQKLVGEENAKTPL